MPGTEQRQRAFQFGVFEMNPQARELRKHGVKLKLQDQPLQILLLLLEHSGEIVTERKFRNASGLKTRMSISTMRSTAPSANSGTL
jgi:DNA-binding response OmpR family regulator